MNTRVADYTTAHRVTGRVETIGAHAVFASAMGLVAITLGCAALGAAVGRGLGAAAVYGCTLAGCVTLCVTSAAARRSEVLAITGLFTAGLLVGLGLGPVLDAQLEADPGTVWHAAAAAGLFIALLGATGYAIQRNLSTLRRVLLVPLVATLLVGLAAALVATPAADRAYPILGLLVFGGFTVVDFNLMRRVGVADVVPLAAGVFLDVLNVFLFLLDLLGSDGDS
jgi:FtsH-binding integral membrane protein